jgi:hypothetical protein
MVRYCRSMLRALFPVSTTLALLMLSADALGAAFAPTREQEPNNVARQAQGPLQKAGIVLRRQSEADEFDVFYFKAKFGNALTLTVKHLSGRCGDSFVVTSAAGPPGPDNGGQDATAHADDAPVIDRNGNVDPAIGDQLGRLLHLTIGMTPEDNPGGLEVGRVFYQGSYGHRVESTVGCRILITASPHSVLVTRRSPADRKQLKDKSLDMF